MKVTHNKLFPIIMSVYTPDYKITQQEKDFLKNLEVRKLKPESGVSTSTCVDIFNTYPELKNIRDVMLDVAEQYKRDVLGVSNELAPLHNWLSKQYEGGHHHKHNHPCALFNLVYYIYGSENAPLKIELDTGKSRLQEGYNFVYNRVTPTPFNSQGHIHSPRDGEIVCIPGWLNHGTDISKGDRMCIGWNFYVNGIVGEDKLSFIEISTRLDNDK